VDNRRWITKRMLIMWMIVILSNCVSIPPVWAIRRSEGRNLRICLDLSRFSNPACFQESEERCKKLGLELRCGYDDAFWNKD
jgi:starvation-inducible outer membrane lipoprotein